MLTVHPTESVEQPPVQKDLSELRPGKTYIVDITGMNQADAMSRIPPAKDSRNRVERTCSLKLPFRLQHFESIEAGWGDGLKLEASTRPSSAPVQRNVIVCETSEGIRRIREEVQGFLEVRSNVCRCISTPQMFSPYAYRCTGYDHLWTMFGT